MADVAFTRQFLHELAEWEGSASPSDVESVEQALGAIAANPRLSGRVASYYDPRQPTYLFRAGTVLIHYRTAPNGAVEFRNLFFRRI